MVTQLQLWLKTLVCGLMIVIQSDLFWIPIPHSPFPIPIPLLSIPIFPFPVSLFPFIFRSSSFSLCAFSFALCLLLFALRPLRFPPFFSFFSPFPFAFRLYRLLFPQSFAPSRFCLFAFPNSFTHHFLSPFSSHPSPFRPGPASLLFPLPLTTYPFSISFIPSHLFHFHSPRFFISFALVHRRRLVNTSFPMFQFLLM